MLEPSETSYFSQPAAGLDPRLFRSGKLTPMVRNAILQLLFNHLNNNYTGSNNWVTVWLAGSGVSYQWAAHRDPGDLDCLIGVDFTKFRSANMRYSGLSDREIAQMLNEGFRSELHPVTGEFLGAFELTFYVNVHSNILDIKPYAAYSVTDDDWTVPPATEGVSTNPDWEAQVESDRKQAVEIMTRYVAAKKRLEAASNSAVKANIQSEMKVAMAQAVALYDSIHTERSQAFSPTGEGYTDFYNYRWQANKRTGVIQALRSIKEELDRQQQEFSQKTYGTELPDASTLIRRAATQYR